jgi:hypothetical protein
MKNVVVLFENYQDTERAIYELYQQGFRSDELSMVAPGPSFRGTFGETVGGVLGTIGDTGALEIYDIDIGPLISAGPIGSALTSAAGTEIGRVSGVLRQFGISEEDARLSAEGLQRGRVLVVVHTVEERAEEARDIVLQAKALLPGNPNVLRPLPGNPNVLRPLPGNTNILRPQPNPLSPTVPSPATGAPAAGDEPSPATDAPATGDEPSPATREDEAQR